MTTLFNALFFTSNMHLWTESIEFRKIREWLGNRLFFIIPEKLSYSQSYSNMMTFHFVLGDQLTAFQDLQDEDAKKKKLQELVVNEVDTNKDGFVTEDEIRARLIKTTKEQRKHEMNNTMITHDDSKCRPVKFLVESEVVAIVVFFSFARLLVF